MADNVIISSSSFNLHLQMALTVKDPNSLSRYLNIIKQKFQVTNSHSFIRSFIHVIIIFLRALFSSASSSFFFVPDPDPDPIH